MVTYRAGTLAEAVDLLQLHYDAVFIDLNVSTLAAHAEVMAHTTAIPPSLSVIAVASGICICYGDGLSETSSTRRCPGWCWWIVSQHQQRNRPVNWRVSLAWSYWRSSRRRLRRSVTPIGDENPCICWIPMVRLRRRMADPGRRVTKPPVELLAPNPPS